MNWYFKYYDVDKGPDWDAIELNCSWFRELKDIPQDSIWHAEGDVQIHTRMVCEEMIKQPEFLKLDDSGKHILFTAALFHDIEKRSTTTEELRDGRLCIVAPSHARKGEGVTREILYKYFDCPYTTREAICKLVRHHGKPLYVISDGESEESILKLSWETQGLKKIHLLSKADVLGRICDDKDELLERLEYFELFGTELGCWDEPFVFANNLSRFKYLSEAGIYKSYEQFNDTKFEVIVMSGIAGAGKDTYIKKTYSGWPVISLDAIRTELKVKPTDKSGNGRVIQLAKERAKEYMRKHTSFVWNATNITRQMRKQLIDLFIDYGAMVTIVYVEVPYNKLHNQNSNRDAVVPSDVVDRMVRKFEPPTFDEAHSISYINNQ